MKSTINNIMTTNKLTSIWKMNDGTFVKEINVIPDVINGGLFHETIPATEAEWNAQETEKAEIRSKCIHFTTKCTIFFLCKGKCEAFDDFDPTEGK